MTPVIDQLPLIDYASGIRNADQAVGRLSERLGWMMVKTFIWGLLSGAAVATGLFLYLRKP